MVQSLLTLFGNKNLLVKVRHNNLLTGYGLFVETRKFNYSEENEYTYFVEIVKELVESNKEVLTNQLEENEKVGKFLVDLTFLANDKLKENHGTRLEIRHAGFFVELLSEQEFNELLESKDINFTDVLEFSF